MSTEQAEPDTKQHSADKCTCCLKIFAHRMELIRTTDLIRKWFFELTQINLVLDSTNKTPQSFICQSCFSDLKFCIEFRKSLIENQKTFLNLTEREEISADVELDDNRSKPFVKREVNGNDPLDAEFVVVKIESFDVNCEILDEELGTSNIPDLTITETNQADDLAECFELFDSSVISRHISEKHFKPSTVKRYFCDKCSYSAAKPNRLERHCQKFHRSSAPKAERKNRSNTESKSRKQCPTCGIFVKNLSEHQKMVHVQVKRFCCDFCNYSCYFKTKITRHIQRHIPKHLREQFPCEMKDCNFFATRKDALKSHILTMHQTAREKICLCIECGKSFYNKSQLNIHKKAVHEKVKNHLCNLCGKSFFNIKDMEMHVKRHGVKDMACEICGNLFYCSLDLRRHLKIHSEPTIACNVAGCSKRFYTNSKLKMHIKIRHEGAKDYFCDYCSSRFSQYNNLKRHVNSVHKSLRINCLIPDCTYSVARKDKYKNHLASQHKFLDKETKETILKSVKFE